MPTFQLHPQTQSRNQRMPGKVLSIKPQDSGWVVGTYDESDCFEQLLPLGEIKPYRTYELAMEAAKIWQSIQPEFTSII